MVNLNSLTRIIEINRLTGPNFFDWFRSQKIMFNVEKIADTLPYIPPTDIPLTRTEEEIITWEILKDHNMRARNYIFASMSNNL